MQPQVSAGASLGADLVSFALLNMCKVGQLLSNGRSQVAVGHLEAVSILDIASQSIHLHFIFLLHALR